MLRDVTSANRASRSQFGKLCLLLLPGVIFYALLWKLCTATPMLDDFDYLITFAVRYAKTPGALDKLSMMVTTQIAPYKALYVYALLGLQLSVAGHLSWPFMLLIGNLTIAGVFAVLARNLMKLEPVKRNLLYLLPVSLLLFNLNYAEVMDYAVAGLAPPSLLFFSLVCLHFLVKPDRTVTNVILATIAGCLASATVINGLFLWPIGAVFLLLNDRRPARWAVWLCGCGVSAFVFFFRYHASGLALPSSLAAKLTFLALFCGGALENMHHRPLPYLSIVIGVFGLGVFLHACVRRYDRTRPFVFYAMTWVVLSALLITAGRTPMGVVVALSSRYKIYCDLLLIFSYAYLLDRSSLLRDSVSATIRSKRILQGGLVVGTIIFVAGNVGGARFLHRRGDNADAAMREYMDSGHVLSPRFMEGDPPDAMQHSEAEAARQLMNEAIRLGIFSPQRP